MEPQAQDLAQFIVHRLESTPPSARLLVALSGVPASGKSCLAKKIVESFEAIAEPARAHSQSHSEAVVVSLDGWHYTRAQLDGFDDPKLAHERRGADWTFDADAYTTFVRRLREGLSPTTPIIYAPSFDHAIKDPVPDVVKITPQHRIVLIEGLYTLTSVDPWREAAELMDERWFIQVELDEAKRRLVKRHVVTKVANDWYEGLRRAEENDLPNGRFVLKNSLDPTRFIQSVNDPLLALP